MTSKGPGIDARTKVIDLKTARTIPIVDAKSLLISSVMCIFHALSEGSLDELSNYLTTFQLQSLRKNIRASGSN